MAQGLLNPWTVMGAGLLSAGGPHMDPSRASLGAGLSQGLQGLMGLEGLNLDRRRADEASELRRQTADMERQKFDLLKGKYAREQSASETESQLRGLLSERIANNDKKGAAAILGLLGEYKESAGLLDSGGGPFEGNAMDAQAYNIVEKVNALRAQGHSVPPELQRAYALAERHLMQPKPAGFDPVTGQPMFTSPTPLPGVQAPAQRQSAPAQAPPQAPARTLNDVDPMAEIPLSEVMPTQTFGLSENEPPMDDPDAILASLKPGAFLTKDQKLALDFPPDAKVQVTRSRGGVKSFDVVSPGSKPTEAEKKSAAQGAIITSSIDTVRNLVESGVEPWTFSNAASNYAAGSGPIQMLAREALESGGVEMTPELAEMSSSIETISNNLLALLRGAQVGPAEQAKFEKGLPRIGQSKQLFMANLVQTERNMEVLRNRYKERTGKDWTGEGVMTPVRDTTGKPVVSGENKGGGMKPQGMSERDWRELQRLRAKHGR